ncbi:MAG: FAD-binding and (Fe-S)-binding domain-containing protein [Solirubrobacterales bacterium]
MVIALPRAHPPALETRALERELEGAVRGEVRFDAGHRAAYGHDSSNYRHPALGVVLPRDADDLAAAVAACRVRGAPVTMRGAGTSLAGEAANTAVVIDTSRHLRRIHEIDPERRIARVDPGVVRDRLAELAETRHGLTFGPDTATHAWATVGGMIGNNSCGVHSVVAGRTSDNVESLEVVTYDGLRLRVGPTSDQELASIIAAGGRRGEIYQGMRDLRDRYADRIRGRFPDIPRRVSGYNLDELLPENGFHVGRLLAGSEGTLAVVTEATVRLVDAPKARALAVLGYRSLVEAGHHVPAISRHDPIGLEAIDRKLVDDMRRRGLGTDELPLLPEGDGFLMVEFSGADRDEALERARSAVDELRDGDGLVEARLPADADQEAKLWAIRGNSLAATSAIDGEPSYWPGWEDAAVAPERLGDYVERFTALLDDYGYSGALYGHFGQGCVHCRIDFDLASAKGVARWRSFLDEAAELVVAHGGSLSGEHGDGHQRAELLPAMFGDELVEAFGELKAIWDPAGGLNPGKVVDPLPIVSHLRAGPDFPTADPPARFAYADDGGSFARATVRCVGAGRCREVGSGTMCPSFEATREEQHSTRGRARILHEMVRGEVIADGFRSPEVHEALDLCLSCKGCATDCPVSVDMATYKAEFLSRFYRRRLRPRAAYSMGLIMVHARIATRAPGLANRLLRSRAAGPLKRLGGISEARELPAFAAEPFTRWFARRGPDPSRTGAEPVVLFPDTFTNHWHPEVLRAAVEVLEAAGRRVLVPERALCCGRPLYGHGMLDTAERLGRRTLDVLAEHVAAGTPMVVVEPSCLAAFRDELPSLLADEPAAQRLAGQALTLAEYLDRHAPEWDPPAVGGRALVHVHCHQEATGGSAAEQALYERMGLDFEVLDSGCCGLAGSFGFEDGHDELSRQIAEQRLLPALRDATPDTLLISDGFSCQTQVAQLSDRRLVHTAEVLAGALRAAGQPHRRAT